MKLINKVSQFLKLAKTMKGAWLLLFLLGLQGFAWGVTLSVINPTCSPVAKGSIKVTANANVWYTYTFKLFLGTGTTTLLSNSGSTASNVWFFTNLNSGDYTIEVVDNSVTTIKYTSVLDLASVIGSGNKTNVKCKNGSDGAAQIIVSGGTTPYTYSWTGPSFSATTQSVSGLVANNYSCTVTDNKGCTSTSTVTIAEPAASLSVVLSTTNITCHTLKDGKASLTPSGGTSPYTYSWTGTGPVSSFTSTSASLTALAAGTYNYVITDVNSCKVSGSATIVEPAAIAISSSKTDVSCKGGSNGAISLTITGGTGAHSYSWTGPTFTATTQNISSLKAGSYTVTVTDANNCTKSSTITISEPAAILDATAGTTNAKCKGSSDGSINLSPSGGTVPYTFLWSNASTSEDQTSLIAGTYSVTITDAKSCTTTKSYTLTEPTVLSVVLSTTNISCNTLTDGKAGLTSSGGTSPYTYSWTGPSSFTSTSASLTALAAGTYNYVVTDANACTKSGSATIVEPTAISISSSKTDVSCKGGSNGAISLTITGGTGAHSYSWTGPTFTATTQNISSLKAGSYTVTVTDANNCTKSSTITISEPAAILDATAVTTNAKCKGSSDGSINLTPSGGTSPYTYSWSNSSTSQNQTSLVAGTYSVTITDAKSCTTTKSYPLTEPTVLSFVLSTTNITCNGLKDGKASLTASGGTAGYTYSWTGPSSYSSNSASLTALAAGTYNYVVTDANSCTKSGSATIQDPDTIAISNVNINVSCNGGNDGDIKLTLTGGSPIGSPVYNYSWTGPGTYAATSKNISGLITGTYVVTVTDNNSCTKNKTINISEPSAIWIADSTIQVSCNGLSDGEIFLKDSGGTGTHTYSWAGPGTFTSTSKNVVGLIAGDYTVTVKDSFNCVKTLKVKVTEPDTIALSATATNLKCNADKSGSIALTISGGTPAYNYDWKGPGAYKNTVDKDLTGIGAGSYKLILTDNNGCVDSITSVVTEPTKMVLTYDSTNVLCFGSNEGYIDVTVSGGTVSGSYIYNWDGPNSYNQSTEDIIKLKAGAYIYTVLDDNNCQLLDTITIFEPAKLQLNIATVSVCDGQGTLTFNAYGGVKPYIYFVDYILSTSPITNLPDKIYNVLTQDSNFCLDSVKVNLIHNDGILPTVNVNNITAYLDNAGSVTIKTSDIDNSSFDNCGVDTMFLDKYTFNCSDVGVDTVILSVVDINGNVKTKKATVNVLDTISPVITVQNTIISIDTSSNAYLKQSMVVLSSSDNCSVDTIVLSKNVFTLSDVGVNAVLITITDKSGNTVIKSVNVTVIIGDSDKDSIPDYLEKNYDTDKDGILDYADVDSDNDGILDVVENEGLKTLVDFDGDTRSNYVDLDSDNDGINDVIEADVTDANNDGVKDDLTYFVSSPNNQDATGKPDYLDLDADDDGMFDAYESRQKYTDSNNDGIIDGIDLDGDGIVEFADGSNAWGDAFDVKPVDSDSDLTGDWRDIDSDGDKIPDAIELMADTDSDGISNYLDLDSDGDKIPDAVEAGATPGTPVDTDSDGKANYLDLDSDGDKIPDSLEAGSTPNTPVDTDSDGKSDYIDTDSDADLIPDAVEAGSDGNIPTDTDKDGIYDFRETDSDKDGINDSIEAGSDPNSPVDTDGDGTPDYQDLDSDGDTIPDKVEGNIDTDGDGKANYIDTDSDNDEILDINELVPNYIIAEVTIPEGFSPNDDADNDVLYIKGLKVFTSAEITIINRNGQVVYESGRGYKNNWDGTNKGSNPSFGTNQLPEGIYFFVFKFNGQNRQPISGNIYIKP